MLPPPLLQQSSRIRLVHQQHSSAIVFGILAYSSITTSEIALNVAHTIYCMPHAPKLQLTCVDCVLMFPVPLVVLAFREIMVSNLNASWRTRVLHFSTSTRVALRLLAMLLFLLADCTSAYVLSVLA